MNMMRSLVLSLLLTPLLGCSDVSEPDVSDNAQQPLQGDVSVNVEAVKAQAAETLQPFKMQLMHALQGGMAEGVVNAIDVCRLQAPAIAEAVTPEGLALGRTSHRVRNPENAPNAWQQHWIDYYLGSDDRQPQVMALDGGEVAYVEPIMTAPMCGACHGSDLSSDVQAALAEHYPDDEATGFAAGELRGIFWLTAPSASMQHSL